MLTGFVTRRSSSSLQASQSGPEQTFSLDIRRHHVGPWPTGMSQDAGAGVLSGYSYDNKKHSIALLFDHRDALTAIVGYRGHLLKLCSPKLQKMLSNHEQ